MAELAVIIVSWNTRALTLDALRTLYADLAAHGPYETDVWLVDNASSDGSAEAVREQFPGVKLIASAENLGFGAGNNAALRAIGFDDAPNQKPRNPDHLPRAVYLLNSDTLTQNGATRKLYDALLSLPDAGIVGARLTYGDGTFQHSGFAFPDLAQLWLDLLPAPARLHESRINGRYPRRLYEGAEPFQIDHPLGATMMLSREAILKTGLFDQAFHMYAEEVDWAWRIQKAGLQAYCIPQAEVIHLGGQSTGQVKPQSILNLWTSRLRLFSKYYSPLKLAAAKQIIRWGMARKIKAAQTELNLSPDERAELIRVYGEIIRLTRSKA